MQEGEGRDRRDRRRRRVVRGGSRADDPPLTTRHAATYTGTSTAWVRDAIDIGHWTPRGLVRLKAETMVLNGRRTHRIHLDDWITFLKQIGWKRIPRHPRETAAA